ATLQAQIDKITAQPTIDQVLTFLRDNRARAFTLDIETDSTIVADENAEKERRTEFVAMLGQLLPQLAQLVTAAPQGGPQFAAAGLKFGSAAFRAGRPLDAAIDDLVQQISAQANSPRPDDPTTAQNKTALQIEQMKNQRAADKDRADTALKTAELQMKD